MTGRMVGFGTILQATTYGGTTASTNKLAYVRDSIDGPNSSRPEIDSTPLSSTAYKEFSVGLIDPGALDLELMFDTTSRGPIQLAGWQVSEKNPLELKIVFPVSTVYMKMQGFVQSLGMAFPRDDMIVQRCTFKLTGAITHPTTSM